MAQNLKVTLIERPSISLLGVFGLVTWFFCYGKTSTMRFVIRFLSLVLQQRRGRERLGRSQEFKAVEWQNCKDTSFSLNFWKYLRIVCHLLFGFGYIFTCRSDVSLGHLPVSEMLRSVMCTRKNSRTNPFGIWFNANLSLLPSQPHRDNLGLISPSWVTAVAFLSQDDHRKIVVGTGHHQVCHGTHSVFKKSLCREKRSCSVEKTGEKLVGRNRSAAVKISYPKVAVLKQSLKWK